MIWLTILQGFSIHLEENWEVWKSKVTSTSLDRRILKISTEEFPFGSPESPWDELIMEATSNAYGAVNESVAELFKVDFSTSTKIDRTAKDVIFLSAVNRHISLYEIVSVFGIPNVAIEGSVDDWRMIRRMIEKLEDFGFHGGRKSSGRLPTNSYQYSKTARILISGKALHRRRPSMRCARPCYRLAWPPISIQNINTRWGDN